MGIEHDLFLILKELLETALNHSEILIADIDSSFATTLLQEENIIPDVVCWVLMYLLISKTNWLLEEKHNKLLYYSILSSQEISQEQQNYNIDCIGTGLPKRPYLREVIVWK